MLSLFIIYTRDSQPSILSPSPSQTNPKKADKSKLGFDRFHHIQHTVRLRSLIAFMNPNCMYSSSYFLTAGFGAFTDTGWPPILGSIRKLTVAQHVYLSDDIQT